ncbi:uncharacterized protein LOC117642725 [Thrips palmi]|uniref:Centromere protein L n=1 Tax=Thrips palmi TaxID=161013 RepID=A0A6P8YK61_THRPL|nr:uncharacterized protein LOC117642725 [Thrips palmi]XP_034237101.1 uncharacterized protein LOC117642725 [Thrips palmi]
MSASSFSSPSPPKRLRTKGTLTSSREVSREKTLPRTESTLYNTPFKSRNQSLCRPNTSDSQVKKAIKKLKGFLNKQWHFFQVSSLFNMDYSEVCMKRYARRLKEKLMSRLPDDSSTVYEVIYTTFPNLKLNDVDHEAVEITVVKINEEGNRTMAYNAVLFSWGARENMQQANAIFLPIMLCQGLKTLMNQVHVEFQLLHDCFVSPFDVRDDELRTLCVGIFDNSSYQDTDNIKLKFIPPNNVKSRSLNISLPANIFSELWKCIPKGDQDWGDAETTTFWKDFHTHTYNSFGIDLGRFGLSSIALPDIVFNKEMVKANRKEQLYLTLSFLMNLINPLCSVAPHVHEVVVLD